jgi:hypothetical protein
MSYKSRSVPRASSSETMLRWQIGDSWGSSPTSVPDAALQDMKFLRSWLVYDSDIQIGVARGRFDWNLIAGIALAVGISVTFWAGIGLMIARVWK